ncbi:MAG: 50S ribosomal protein L35 [Deltaproteobacteria bacterium]|nr:50S ribosomal protein L35 [Candidatus Anaeroferrophillus wilburensis]MBN2889718.1 50S ribosomal protein L35 [Deltaproteobacteria bacterium]
MPKMKSNSGARKRFKTTGTGKIVRRKAYASHLLSCKSRKRKRNLRKSTIVDASNARGIIRMLPYL